MKRISSVPRTGGFTLVELMIVVAVIGTLSSIALPAYKNFVIRARLAEAYASARVVKLAVMEYQILHGHFDALDGLSWSKTLSELGVKSNFFGDNSGTVKNIWWSNSAQQVRVSFSDSVPELSGKRLVFQADGGSVFNWICLPTDGNTDPIPSEYLPSNCQ